ncbi:MAG: carboxypeptidase regulatory-like domain-containing protein, partial [Bacteroidota bacterium]
VYTTVGTKKVAEVVTDDKGKYAISLKPGKYSVFTKEAGGYFSNRFDSDNNIGVVTVTADNVTTYDIKIDFKASY